MKLDLSFSDDEIRDILRKSGYIIEFVECRSYYTRSGKGNVEVCYKQGRVPDKIKNANKEIYEDLASIFSVQGAFEEVIKEKIKKLF